MKVQVGGRFLVKCLIAGVAFLGCVYLSWIYSSKFYDEQLGTEGYIHQEFYTANVKQLRDSLPYERGLPLVLAKIQEIKAAGYWQSLPGAKTCDVVKSPVKPCVDRSCDATFLKFEDRVQGILSSMRSRDLDTLSAMMKWAEFQAPPTKKRILFLTAASSNHFYESLALMKNLQENVFPKIDNYTLILYDLGFTVEERRQMKKFCDCEIRTFPVEKLPKPIQSLTCYVWKPLIVQAHINTADLLLYMDASPRFFDGNFEDFLESVKVQGVALLGGGNSIPQNVDFRMMNYFRTSPCLYTAYDMRQATFIAFHNERFVRELIVKPWAACAVNPECMCPPNSRRGCPQQYREIGKCHRYDQAAFNLIIVNLFGRYVASLDVRHQTVKLMRGHKLKINIT